MLEYIILSGIASQKIFSGNVEKSELREIFTN